MSTRKEQILQMLLEQLTVQPENITTKSLAHALGMTESALYRHFASKRQMFAQLIGQIDERLDALVQDVLEQGENYIDMMRDIACGYLSLVRVTPGYTRLLLLVHLEREDTKLVTDMLAVLEKYEGAFRHIMRDMERSTQVRVAVKHLEASSFIMSYLQGILLRSLYIPYKMDPVQQLEVHWPQLTESLFVPQAE